MRYIIILLLLSGCVSNSFIPATVSQVDDVRSELKETKVILADLAKEVAPDSTVTTSAINNNAQFKKQSAPNQYDQLITLGVGIAITALTGGTATIGGAAMARKKFVELKKTVRKVADMNPDDAHKHLTKVG